MRTDIAVDGRVPPWGTVAGDAALPSGRTLAWIVVAPPNETSPALILDEQGGLWWASLDGRTARFVRPCPRSEAREHADRLVPRARWLLLDED